MTGIQKAIIGAVLTASVGVAVYSTRQAALARTDLANARSAAQQQASQLQVERDELSSKLASANQEQAMSRSNLQELVRLRGEVASMRRARSGSGQPVQATTTGTETPSQIPKTSWEDAGFETPQALLRTRGWCVLNGNRERFKDSLFVTDGARKALEDMFVRMAEQSQDPNKEQMIQMVLNHKLGVEEGILMPMMAENQQRGYTGYQILSQEQAGDDGQVLKVETTLKDGSKKQETLKLRRFGSDWKVVIDEDLLRQGH